MRPAQYWISKLNLAVHPEGGYYREIFRSSSVIPRSALPENYSSDRNHGTSIYFLLDSGQKSRFHRLKSDEIWYFHDGSPARVHLLSPEGKHLKKDIGLDYDSGQEPQVIIPGNHWFAVELLEDNGYILAGCGVFPGFEFEDFELAVASELAEAYPQHKDVIEGFV